MVTSAFAQSIPPSEVALDTVVSGKYAQLDLWHAGTRADRAAARRLLRLAGIARLADREWAYLSQGLDPVARRRFLATLERIARHRGLRTTALVLVTHHVEEITPAFSHALLLRGGRVLAAGPRGAVLNSANLSRTFGAPLRLRRRGAVLELDTSALR